MGREKSAVLFGPLRDKAPVFAEVRLRVRIVLHYHFITNFIAITVAATPVIAIAAATTARSIEGGGTNPVFWALRIGAVPPVQLVVASKMRHQLLVKHCDGQF